jgi:hypothetical protein
MVEQRLDVGPWSASASTNRRRGPAQIMGCDVRHAQELSDPDAILGLAVDLFATLFPV